MIAHRTVAATTVAVSLLFGASALAQQANTLPLKIGVLADFASVYADIGQGNVEAAKIAIEEFGGKMFSKPIGAGHRRCAATKPTSPPPSRANGKRPRMST